ncbi:hypothetical protein [Streptomyces sp. NPDC057696]|uniref:hypothetical protein n=1 Tax=Streptomyces sp. NPDC057696 TaxID=3346218 RepID=UPI003694D70C
MGPFATPRHSHRIVEKVLGVFQPNAPEELDDVAIGAGKAKNLAVHGDPSTARTERRMHNCRNARHASRVHVGLLEQDGSRPNDGDASTIF